MIGRIGVALAITAPISAQPSGPDGNLPLPPEVLQRRLQNDDFEITAVEDTRGGIMGAKKLTVVFPSDGFTTDVKWKEADDDGEVWNNAPRREIAANAVQQLFLDPDDYVVPPVAARCIPLAVYRAVDETPTPNVHGAQCVFGVVSAWLQNVTRPDEALQPKRFSTDPRYCYHFANLNLLTYVIAHRDARSANFLISTDAADPHVFSIDNGIAFGGVLYNFFTWHLDRIMVGGLPQRSIERIRRVTPADLARFGVVAELRADDGGVLRSVEPSANVDPDVGVRQLADGIQLGLTAQEIDAMAARIRVLARRIDRGKISTF